MAAISIWEADDEISIVWTPWQRVEVFNAIRQAERLGHLASASPVIRAIEKEVRLGYWPHVEFDWTSAVRTANELSAEHARTLPIRAMDLFHVAVACEIGADRFLTFDDDQAALAEAAGLVVWNRMGRLRCGTA